MPLIQSVDIIPDDGGGILITLPRGNTIQLTKGMLPANVQSGTAQEIEDWCNARLTVLLASRSFFAQIHVITSTPLVPSVVVSDNGASIPPNWWART